ncbi:MAG: hypothetical protein CMJ79_04330 [Planctomycetaceae bacterium]|nr:hypothetical protein [Planctomycetaceae bacterium]|tara:strand:- start:8175 stop:9155 length:981 start_codon:yes stop_codon:yes gene_type:complete
MYPSRRPITSFLFTLIALLVSLGSTASAQDDEKPETEIPPVESHVLETKDGVFLHVKYYPGTKGKDSIPIIMLHSMLNVSASNAVYTKLASDIQKHMGHAVIIPDLRGHGKSLEQRDRMDVNDRVKIDREKFTKTQFASVVQDIEVCKSFLRDKNDQGQLNLEKLTVVGSDITAIIAMNWAAIDWNKPGGGFIRNGQDVKALILFTPLQSHKGLTPQLALSHQTVKQNLNIMIIAGSQNTQYYSQSKRIHNQLTRFHKEQENDDGTINWSGTKLFLFGLNTGAQGSGILNVAKLQPHPNALFYNFLVNRLEKDETLAWSKRDRTNE